MSKEFVKDLKNLNSMIDEVKDGIYDILNSSTIDSRPSACSKIYRAIYWLPDGISKVNLVDYIFEKGLIDIKIGYQKDIVILNDIVKILRRIDFEFNFVISQDELDELYSKFLRICANNNGSEVEDIVTAINQVCDLNIDVNSINPVFANKISIFYERNKTISEDHDIIKTNIKTLLNEYNHITYSEITRTCMNPFVMLGIGGMNPMMGMGRTMNPMGMNMGMPGMMGNPFFYEADHQININVLTGLCNITRYITNSMHVRNDFERKALDKINITIIEAIETFGRS